MPIKLVLPALAVLFLTALPAGASAREPGEPCPTTPAIYGQSDDNETWLRLPPYPEGRNAEHIYYGNATVQVEVHDLSAAHNFRIRDLTWGGSHYDRSTGAPGDTGIQCWNVPLEVQSGIESGDYEWLSDQDPNFRRGVVVNHPVVVGPPPPPPPPGPPPPPPPPGGPPPPPDPIPDFIFTVGPDQRIGVFYAATSRRMTRIPPGTYTIQVHDLSTTHDFHLTGPGGVDRRTEVDEIEHPIWTVTFREGTYTFKCDVHASMRGTFVVSNQAAPVPKCKVPRLVGRTLTRARRMIRAARCSVGRIRRVRSKQARNRVVSQRPRAGRVLAATSKVNFAVSRGPG
jgi:hypothetical protein